MSVPHSLVELDAELVRNISARYIGREASRAEADGLMFLCPLCFTKNGGARGTHRVLCWFVGRVPDDLKPGPGRWTLSGAGLADFSLTPSVDLSITKGGCQWHGFVTNGSAA
jgi:hypothetical protein